MALCSDRLYPINCRVRSKATLEQRNRLIRRIKDDLQLRALTQCD